MRVLNRVPELVAEKFGGADHINLQTVQRETGLNYVTVSRWVKNRVDRVEFKTLAVWCHYLGVQPGDILIYEPDQPAN